MPITPKRVKDNVNHPPHYETGKFESIEVMEEVFGRDSVKDFCLCNAFKYLYRCQKKHETPVEDVEKAVWYLNRYLQYCYTTTASIEYGDNLAILENDKGYCLEEELKKFSISHTSTVSTTKT